MCACVFASVMFVCVDDGGVRVRMIVCGCADNGGLCGRC